MSMTLLDLYHIIPLNEVMLSHKAYSFFNFKKIVTESPDFQDDNKIHGCHLLQFNPRSSAKMVARYLLLQWKPIRAIPFL